MVGAAVVLVASSVTAAVAQAGALHTSSKAASEQSAPPVAVGSNAAPASLASLPTLASGEVPSLRTAHSSTFRNAAGGFSTKLTTGLLNYQDSNGAWQPIDPTLVAGPDGSWTAKASPVALSLPGSLSSGVSVGTSAGTVTFALNGAAPVAPSVSGTTATYAGALPGVDVAYDSDNSSLKENLTLASAAAPSSFTYTLTTTAGLSLSDAGGAVSITDSSGGQVFGLAAPTVTDASNTWAGATTGSVAMTVAPVAGKDHTWTVTETVDPTWLAAPARVFPVTVDPLVTFGASSAEQGCWFASDGTPGVSRCADSTYIIGHGGTPGSGGYGRTMVEFPDITTAIPRDAVVTDADLSLYESAAENSNTVPVEAMRMTQQWTTNATYTTYDGTNNWASAGGDFVGDPNWVYVDPNAAGHVGGRVDLFPTAAVRDWVNGEVPNDGLMLKGIGTELSIDNYLSFSSWNATSSQWPTLTVDWDSNYAGATEVSQQLNDHVSLNVNPAGGNGQIVQATSSFSAPGIGFAPSVAFNSTRIVDGPIGLGWTSNLGGDVELVPNGGGVKLIGPYAAPSFYQLSQNSDGTAKTDGSGNTLYITPAGGNADLSSHPDTVNGGTIYTLTFHKDGQVWSFHSTSSPCYALTADQSCATLISQKDRNGNGLTFSYDLVHQTASYTPPLVGVADAGGRSFTIGEKSSAPYWVSGITDPTSRTWAFTHGTSDTLTTVQDPTGAQTVYGYDSSNRVSSITTAHTSASGGSVAVTAIGYDSSNRVTSVMRVTNPTAPPASWVGPTTTFTYNPFTTVSGGIEATTVVTDPLSHSTTYTYDTHDNVINVVDADSHSRSNTYTSNFDPSTITDGLSAVSTLSYDGLNNLKSIQAPNSSGGSSGRTSTLDYPTATGSSPYPLSDYQPTDSKDAQGNETTYSYDTAGNLATTTPPTSIGGSALTNKYQGDPGVTSCGGKNGELCSSTDGRGNTTTYSYDSAGNPTTSTPPAPLHATTTTFDSLGRITSVTDGDGNKTTYGYDGDDRITSLEFAGHTTCTPSDISAGRCITYTYDGDGNITARADSTGTTTFGYDVLNRPTSKALAGTTTSSLTYDAASNIATYVDAGGTTTYGYDPANLLTSLAEPGGSCTGTISLCTTFTNDANGNRTLTTYPSGETVAIGYDTSQRETSVTAKRPSGTVFLSRTYVYGTGTGGTTDTDLRQKVTDQAGASTSYTYDGLNRLTAAATTSVTWGYSYDAVGNRTTSTKTGTSTIHYGYNNANQLCWSGTTTGSNGTTACPTTPMGDTAYTYDNNGNQLTAGSTQSQTYNALNQTASSTTSGTATALGYSDIGQAERTSAGSTTFLNGLDLGLTAQTTSGTTVRFVRDPSGNLIAMHTSSGSNYYVLDALGSVIALTNAAGTTDTALYTYDPYGNTLTSSGTLASTNPYRYASGYQDASGRYHYGQRYYSTGTGTWAQQDSLSHINDPTQANRYTYAGADPINATDPGGQDLFSSIVGAAVGVVAGVTCGVGAAFISGGTASFAAGLACGTIASSATSGTIDGIREGSSQGLKGAIVGGATGFVSGAVCGGVSALAGDGVGALATSTACGTAVGAAVGAATSY